MDIDRNFVFLLECNSTGMWKMIKLPCVKWLKLLQENLKNSCQEIGEQNKAEKIPK